MIIKTDEFVLEVSHGNDVYFGSRTSGQIFKKWEDIGFNEKIRIEHIAILVEQLIKEYEVEYCSLKNDKLSMLDV